MTLAVQEELSIRLRVPAEWSGIEPVREAVGKVLHVVCTDRDVEDAVSMVCAELLDNALRYGRHDGVCNSTYRYEPFKIKRCVRDAGGAAHFKVAPRGHRPARGSPPQPPGALRAPRGVEAPAASRDSGE